MAHYIGTIFKRNILQQDQPALSVNTRCRMNHKNHAHDYCRQGRLPLAKINSSSRGSDCAEAIERRSSTGNALSLFLVAVVAILFAAPAAAFSFDVQVSAGADDAEENSTGSILLNSSDLELVFDRDSNQTVGMRFNGVNVPAGATIQSAYIQFTVDERTSGDTSLTIEGHAADSAAPFISSSFNLSSRPRTSASIGWTPPPWLTTGAAGLEQRTPDIASIIQEIIVRPGWSANNSIAILITGIGERVAESFNGVPASAPRLHIEFSGDPVNLAPQVDAGADAAVILPNTQVSLDGTVTDDQLPIDTLTTSWSHVGGTGNGVVSFENSSSVDTTVTFTADPGTYILRLTADDSVLSAFDEVTITVNSDAMQALDRQIISSSDDAEEQANGRVSLTSSDLELVYDRGGNQTVGMRFNEIDIAPGASVINAYIQFTVDEAQSQSAALIIEGEASSNASTFANVSFNISSRPRTVANQAWYPNPWTTVGQAGVDQRTPNLAGIIQEIVNSPGWSSGNSLALLVTGNGERIAESFNGVRAAAPRLHIEFAGSTSNQPPSVNAGADTSLTLPGDTVFLDGTVTDDGQSNAGLITVWSHVGGTGSGVVTFGDPSAIDTTATITPDVGTYVLRLSASDGELSAEDELTVTVREEATGGEVVDLRQVSYFATGFGSNGIPLAIPSIDPAGIVYHAPSGRLFIADSEINEVGPAWDIVGSNLFETSTSGSSLFDQWNLTLRTGNEPYLNREPTGIAYCEGDGHFYVTNDDTDLIYRYAYDGTTFTAVDAVSTRPIGNDPEGITCDPVSGRLYVIDGTGIDILVYRYDSGFVLEDVLHLPTTAGTSAGVPGNPEGIAFDPVSGHLFLVSDSDRAIFEYSSSGAFVNKFSVDGFSPRPTHPQGLGIGQSSANPQTLSIYIADGRVDNDYDPNERDGIIYEAEIQRAQ